MNRVPVWKVMMVTSIPALIILIVCVVLAATGSFGWSIPVAVAVAFVVMTPFRYKSLNRKLQARTPPTQ